MCDGVYTGKGLSILDTSSVSESQVNYNEVQDLSNQE